MQCIPAATVRRLTDGAYELTDEVRKLNPELRLIPHEPDLNLVMDFIRHYQLR